MNKRINETVKGEKVSKLVQPYKPLYLVKEVAQILMINPNRVYDLMYSKQLPYLKLGAKKIRGSDLEAFIEKYPVEEISNQDKVDML